jgi:hypothetical protein
LDQTGASGARLCANCDRGRGDVTVIFPDRWRDRRRQRRCHHRDANRVFDPYLFL